ncbi:MAG: MFS transporter [Candidatus Omnitrophica bacterium]|nr:MFS transporter [Candidatus Omnitrophota bacterium]
MRNGRSPLAVIFLTVFIDLVGFGIVIPVLPLYAQRFGASPLVIGLLLGIYSAMQCLAAPLLGRLSDRVGRRPVLLLSILGTSLGFLLMGLAHTLQLLFIARVIDGITGGNISTAQAYIADVTKPEERSRGMGLIGAAFGLGFIFGPAIGGVLSRVSLGAPFLFAAVLAAANATAVYFLLPESLAAEQRGKARERASALDLFSRANGRALSLIFATYFFTTVAFSLLTATYPLFTQQRFGYDAAHNGYIFAFLGIIGAVVQGVLLGPLLRLTTERALAITGTALLAVSLFALPLSLTPVMLLATTTLIAVGHGLVAATLNGLASKSAEASAQGRMLGLMQSAASLARIAGPVLGGWLLNHDAVYLSEAFGRTPYWTGGGVMLVALALAFVL